MYLQAEWFFQLSRFYLNNNRSPVITRGVPKDTYLAVLFWMCHRYHRAECFLYLLELLVIGCPQHVHIMEFAPDFFSFYSPPLSWLILPNPNILYQRRVFWVLFRMHFTAQKNCWRSGPVIGRPISHKPWIRSAQWLTPFAAIFFPRHTISTVRKQHFFGWSFTPNISHLSRTVTNFQEVSFLFLHKRRWQQPYLNPLIEDGF